MKRFLDQTSILGCRIVDALASGKTKQLIHNSKNMIWQGIELAVDPSTIVALAEVTAHLCHALEELVDDSSHPTPRTIRNIQNDTTYLQPVRMTDHPSNSMEHVILSSLGFLIQEEESHDLFDDDDNDDDDDDDILLSKNDEMSVNSVPSNVVFPKEQSSTKKQYHHHSSPMGQQYPNKGKVNVPLLREQILNQERSLARITPILDMDNKNGELLSSLQLSSSGGTPPVANNNKSNNINEFRHASEKKLLIHGINTFGDDGSHGDMEESAGALRYVDRDTSKYQTDMHRNVEKPYSALEEKWKSVSEPSAVKFYQTVHDLLQRQRQEKQWNLSSIASKDLVGVNAQTLLQRRAKVRHFRGKHHEEVVEQFRSRDIQQRYATFRRVGKYPHAMLGLVFLLWGGFGFYGFYSFCRVRTPFRGSTPSNSSNNNNNNVRHLAQPIDPSVFPANPRPNEIVLRIVKEVIHVSNEGREIAMGNKEESEISEKEMKEILQCFNRQ
jgi:hypothetical protein